MKPQTFKARVTALVARAELPPVSMTEDAADKRIKIQLQARPDHGTRNLLVSYGFRYRGGTTNAWVRKLDDNGRRAARAIMQQLIERTEEDNQ